MKKTKIDEPRNVKPAGFKMLNAEEYNKSTAVVFTPHHDASLEVRARPANTSTNCRPSTLLTNSLFRNATISTMETNSYRRVFGRLAHVDINMLKFQITCIYARPLGHLESRLVVEVAFQ